MRLLPLVYNRGPFWISTDCLYNSRMNLFLMLFFLCKLQKVPKKYQLCRNGKNDSSTLNPFSLLISCRNSKFHDWIQSISPFSSVTLGDRTILNGIWDHLIGTMFHFEEYKGNFNYLAINWVTIEFFNKWCKLNELIESDSNWSPTGSVQKKK